jgi:hypothetical protein
MVEKRRQLPWDWRERLEIVVNEGEKEFDFILQFKNGKEIKGFDKEVGTLSAGKKDPHFVSVVEVAEYFRGRGQGKRLYLAAIEKFGKLSTKYYDASTLSRRVWKSLAKTLDFDTDFWEGRLTVYKEKSDSGQND